jgi:hypothetical protein
VQSGAAGPYVPVPKGDAQVKAGAKTQSLPVEAGKFYTVSYGAKADASGFHVLADPAPASLSKAGLVVYNLTSTGGLSLTTADGTVTVLPDIAAGAVAGREVNALNVGFAIKGASGNVATVAPTQLTRGHVYSVIVRDAAGAVSATCAENTTTTGK